MEFYNAIQFNENWELFKDTLKRHRKIVKKTFSQFLQCKKIMHESKLLKNSKNGQISF